MCESYVPRMDPSTEVENPAPSPVTSKTQIVEAQARVIGGWWERPTCVRGDTRESLQSLSPSTLVDGPDPGGKALSRDGEATKPVHCRTSEARPST